MVVLAALLTLLHRPAQGGSQGECRVDDRPPRHGEQRRRHLPVFVLATMLGVGAVAGVAVMAQQLPATAGPKLSEAIVNLGQATVETLLVRLLGG